METKKICAIHGETLVSMKVPISYGLPNFDDPYFEARNELFPNANTYVLGGCMVGSMGSESDALVCHACRQAEDLWRKENKRQIKPGR